ncbi:hypothetical protein [Actinoplanes sp. L3-i22]|uniref:hypothetical protein n=1 Tax=Actinoplanes sp. L3-i22 TaxID=2836373 RepID=UPI001C8610EF|nr:hypothetical protein [Actinoplanes sp. L3-i22]
MNTVSANTSSMSSLATSVFGNARQAFKAIADAATSNPDGAEKSGTAPTAAGKSVRRGTVLDRYM